MGDNGHNNGTANGQITPMPSGGAGCALDMANERDRAAVRRAIADWPRRFRALTPDVLDGFVLGLVEAKEAARSIEDPGRRALALDSCARTATMMERLHQADEHKAIDVLMPTQVKHEHSGGIDHRVVAIVPDRDG